MSAEPEAEMEGTAPARLLHLLGTADAGLPWWYSG